MLNKSICKNAWCRATYSFEGDMPPGECPKCNSFNSDLSAGVSWVDKKYDGPRDDGKPHQTSINTKYYGGK